MSAREWVLPLVLGLVAAGLVVVLPAPSLPHDDPLPTPVEEPLGLAWAFHEAVAEPGKSIPFLAVGEPSARSLDLTCLDGPRSMQLHSESPVLWRVDIPAGCRTPGDVLAVTEASEADTERFGEGGRNATVVTIFVFNEQGELLASNAGATSRNRYHLYGDFVTLSSRPWYLGEGPTPQGMRVPDGYESFARKGLAGLPVGATAHALVERHEYDWLVGSIWVLVQIDELLDVA